LDSTPHYANLKIQVKQKTSIQPAASWTPAFTGLHGVLSLKMELFENKTLHGKNLLNKNYIF
jgi:hypothetical protein